MTNKDFEELKAIQFRLFKIYNEEFCKRQEQKRKREEKKKSKEQDKGNE